MSWIFYILTSAAYESAKLYVPFKLGKALEGDPKIYFTTNIDEKNCLSYSSRFLNLIII
jgi:hypothetical protein